MAVPRTIRRRPQEPHRQPHAQITPQPDLQQVRWPALPMERLLSCRTVINALPTAPRNRRASKAPKPVTPSLAIPPANAALWAETALKFIPDEKQRLILETTANRGILNCTRQWGKSTTCAIKAVHFALLHPGSLTVVASPSARQSGEFMRKTRQAVAAIGIRPRGDGENRCSLLFPNGSRIVGLPENKDTVRGFSDVGLLIVDEASRVSDDFFEAICPMLAVSNGSLWLMSTPNGRSGFFFREWSDLNRDWLRITATAEQCPRISRAFLQEQRLTRGDEFYRQEFCGEFVCAEGALFDEDQLRSLIDDGMQPLW